MSVDNTFLANYILKEENKQNQQILRSLIAKIQQLQSQMHKHIIKSNTSFKNEENQKNMINLPLEVSTLIDTKLEYINTVTQENFNNLQSHINEGQSQLYEKMKRVQSKILRLLNEKQQAMDYLQFRLQSVENENRSIKQLISRSVSENKKYEGIVLMEERICQNEQICQLRENKIKDSLILLEEKLRKQTLGKIQEIEQRIEEVRSMNEYKEEKDEDEEILDKFRQLQLGHKQNQRKIMEIERDIKQSSGNSQFDNIKRKVLNLEDEFTQTRVNWQEKFNKYVSENRSSHESQNKSSNKLSGKQDNYESALIRNKINNQYGRKNNNFRGNQSSSPELSEPDPKETASQAHDIGRMRGGIRGLLQKSKEKQVKEHPKPFNSLAPSRYQSKPEIGRNKPGLPRQNKLTSLSQLDYPSNPKSLPPVKEDPKRMRDAQMGDIGDEEEEYEEDEEGVYNVDEDGYLMDQDGNYLYNQYGEQLRLDQQDLAQLLKQQNS